MLRVTVVSLSFVASLVFNTHMQDKQLQYRRTYISEGFDSSQECIVQVNGRTSCLQIKICLFPPKILAQNHEIKQNFIHIYEIEFISRKCIAVNTKKSAKRNKQRKCFRVLCVRELLAVFNSNKMNDTKGTRFSEKEKQILYGLFKKYQSIIDIRHRRYSQHKQAELRKCWDTILETFNANSETTGRTIKQIQKFWLNAK